LAVSITRIIYGREILSGIKQARRAESIVEITKIEEIVFKP
jgi:hypothetical protein